MFWFLPCDSELPQISASKPVITSLPKNYKLKYISGLYTVLSLLSWVACNRKWTNTAWGWYSIFLYFVEASLEYSFRILCFATLGLCNEMTKLMERWYFGIPQNPRKVLQMSIKWFQLVHTLRPCILGLGRWLNQLSAYLTSKRMGVLFLSHI